MIPGMTQPEEEEVPRTATVTLGGHEFQVKNFTDVQLLHINRHARILAQESIAWDARSESMNRMFGIIHSRLLDSEQLQFLIGLEEDGEVTLRDLLVIARKFQEPEPDAAPVVVRRRGRPRKSL